MADGKRKTQGYDRLKQHQGKGYSGMQIGRSHKWYYDQGEWRERKLSPDEWEISYQTTKRRAARAPEESGAPVGTQYNWLIVSHQRVDKLDANSYMTCMEGRKFKVAHKRARKDAWSATESTQRKRVIQYLEQMIEELKQADESEALPYSVGQHEHIYGLNLRTKAELLEMAKDYAIPGTSKMKRAELLDAVKAKLNRGGAPLLNTDNGEQVQDKPTDVRTNLQSKTRDVLYKLASDCHIGGRSKMTKSELAAALAAEMRYSPQQRARL